MLIVEVDKATDEVVLSIRIPSVDLIGWQTYRSEHLDTWYPHRTLRSLRGDPPLP